MLVCYARSATTTMLAVAPWVGPAKAIVEPVLDLGGIAFLIRIILSWYPQVSEKGGGRERERERDL